MPLYFKKNSDILYDYIVCGSVDVEMFSFINKCVNEKGKSVTVLLYDTYPPTEYLDNLAYYIHNNRDCNELLLEPKVCYDDWKPEELAYDSESPNIISDTIKETLENQECCILQGPPGTGKSYTIATIVASYLEQGKSVCVTTHH